MFSKVIFSIFLFLFPAASHYFSNSSLNIVAPNNWVEMMIASYPELEWFLDERVAITHEGISDASSSFSFQQFGKQYVEFDRTLTSLKCLEFILEGNYEEFTKKQKSEEKLSKKQFKELSLSGNSLIKNERDKHLFFVASILADLAKCPKARELFKAYGIEEADHDDFYKEALKVLLNNPELSPSFASLSENERSQIVKSASLVHFGHITHLEGGAEMFDGLRAIIGDTHSLNIALFLQICDVAGALGHVQSGTSLALTRDCATGLDIVKNACLLIVRDNQSSEDAYRFCIAKRGEITGFDIQKKEDWLLCRIAAMMRIYDKQQSDLLKEAFVNLPPNDKIQILEQLEVPARINGRTPTYIPAVLVNLANNKSLGETREERLQKTIELGLPLIASILKSHQEKIANQEISSKIPLNFNPIAKVAKEPKALFFNKANFLIKINGEVLLDFLDQKK